MGPTTIAVEFTRSYMRNFVTGDLGDQGFIFGQ
jgi:hypothetical protein